MSVRTKFYSLLCCAVLTCTLIPFRTDTVYASNAALSASKLLATSIDIAAPSIKSSTSENYATINVSSGDISTLGCEDAIQNALDTARDRATASNPYKIVVAPGNYTLDSALNIYSNTYLSLQGVTLTQTKDITANMLKVGATNDTSQGYYYQNITIDGGIWNQNGNSNTSIKICHAKNVKLINATIKNCKNSHLTEIAGVDGLLIQNCKFADQKLSTDAKVYTYEAIQFDILLDSHLSGYISEDLPLKNVTVTGCDFTNVPRGIGSHTAILNSPVDTITITNNTFTNLKSLAIQAMNYKNCTITNNIIKNCPQGIMVYSIRESGTFLASTAVSEGGVASSTPNTYVTPSEKQNITISDNQIQVSGTDPYEKYENAAIFVSGLNLSKDVQGSGDKIPAGNYFISDVTINNNTIQTAGHGIRLQDVKTSTISKNEITYTNTSSKAFYGIQLREGSTNSTVSGNTLTTPVSGIHVYATSSADAISGNTIIKPQKNGIMIEDATANLISSNTVSTPGTSGIFIYQTATVGTITENTVTGGKNNLNVDNCTVTTISKNKFSSASTNALFFHNNCNITSVEYNTITSIGKHGMFIESATVNTIKNNTISNPPVNGIHIYSKSNVTNISGNTISSAKNNGIAVENSTATNIQKNTVSSPGVNGIHIYKKGKSSSISSNKVSSAKNYGISVTDGTATKIEKNTISSPSNFGIHVFNNGKTSSVSKNKITSGKKRGISISAIKTNIKVTGNTIKNCKELAIYCNPSSTAYTISITKNSITGKSKVDGIYVDSGKLTISDNTIKTCKRPIVVSVKAKVSIYPNSFSKTQTKKIQVGSQAASTPKSTSISFSSKKKTSVKLKWKKVSGASGYEIYRSTSKNGTYKKCATIKKGSSTTYTDKKLKSKRTYYYKIVAYKQLNNKKVTVYGTESSINSVKTK